MKTYGRLNRTGATLLAAALLLGAAWGSGGSGGNAGARPGFEGFRPYVPAAKNAYASVPEDVDSSQIVVKFRQRTSVRLRDGGLVSLRGGTEEARELGETLGLLARHNVLGIARLFTRPEEDLDEERRRGEQNTGVELGDLNLYFMLDAGDLMDAAKVAFVNDLNALSIVETAYFASVPELAMITRAEAGLAEDDFDNAIVPSSHGNYQGMQGYLNPAPDGIDALFAWTQLGGKGAGIKIMDVEGGWNVNHEDLPSPFVVFGTNNNDCSTDGPWYDHGTAVLGEMVSKSDGLGTTGISHESTYGVSSVFGQTVSNAISKAAGALAAGDVLLIELHYSPPSGWAPSDCGCSGSQCGYVPVEYYQAEYNAILNATANGVTVVEAAGNGSSNLDHPFFEGKFDKSVRDSGAVMAGAGNAGTRLPSCFTNFGSRLDAHGWGNWTVVTTGYGNLNPGECFGCGSCPIGERNHLYTNTFAGTSSASPIVTGAVACVQGEYKSRTGGGVYTPLQVRQLLTDTGTPQAASAKAIGPLPNLFAAICPAIACSISVDQADVCYGTAQTFTVTASGGKGALSFAWDIDGDGFDDGTGSPISFTFLGGTRTVRMRVTDSASCGLCVAEVQVTVTPAPYVSGISARCADGPCATLTAFDDFVSYLWSPGGETTKSICAAPASTTDYTVTVTDENGCTGPSAPFTLTVHPNPAPVVSGSASRCANDPCTTLDAGAGYASYLWSPDGETGRFICAAPVSTTDYAVTVTGAGGCQGTSPAHTLDVLPNPAVTIVGATTRCAGEPCTTLAANASGGSGASYAYLWSTGETTQSVCVTGTATRTVTVTDSMGCPAVSPAHTLTEKPAPDASFTHDAPKCNGEAVAFAANASPGGTQILFFDNADDGLAGWTATTNVDVSSESPSGCTAAGNNYFRLSNDAASADMWRLVDTTGFASIRVRADWRKQNLDIGECFALQYTVDGGGSWVTWFQRCSTSSPNAVWTCGQTSAILPDAANNNPNFGVRFALTANETDEQAWLDRVVVEGTGAALSYCWDFHGDGDPCDATTQNASFAYSASGLHTTRLTVSDGTCAAATTQGVQVDFCGGAPTTPVTGAAFGAGGVLSWGIHPEAEAYDVYRDGVSMLPLAGNCLQSGWLLTSFDDAQSPAPGGTWFYLVNARNAAGVGPLGTDSDGQARAPATACP